MRRNWCKTSGADQTSVDQWLLDARAQACETDVLDIVNRLLRHIATANEHRSHGHETHHPLGYRNFLSRARSSTQSTPQDDRDYRVLLLLYRVEENMLRLVRFNGLLDWRHSAQQTPARTAIASIKIHHNDHCTYCNENPLTWFAWH